jgi:replication factor A1
MHIKDLKPKMGKVDITASVISKDEPRTFDKFGKAGQVCNARVKDESGEITLTLWNDQVGQVNVGDTVKITNGYVDEFRGNLQVSTGKFGAMEVTKGSGAAPAPTKSAPTGAKADDEDDGFDDLNDLDGDEE